MIEADILIKQKRIFAALAVSAALAGCSATATPDVNGLPVIPGVTYFPSPTVPPTATPIPTPTPAIKYAQIDVSLPQEAQVALAKALSGTGLVATTAPQNGAVAQYDAVAGGRVVLTRTYVLAAPFPTIADGISLGALQAFWQGNADALSPYTNDKKAPLLFMDADTRKALGILLGAPADGAKIGIVAAGEIPSRTFATRPSAFAILPFEQLEGRWKAMKIDDAYALDKAMDEAKYPLTLRVYEKTQAAPIVSPITNRDTSKMAIVAMTGVTALVRGTAIKMEEKGVLYPAAKIRDWFLTADVRHISNEISFYDKCPFPTRNDGTKFCSNPKYIDMLKDIGANLIDLTGNHLWDYGWQNLLPTLDTYDQLGWKYFGGGRNLTDSLKPVTMTVNGNKIAFVGCNWFGMDWATSKVAGSAPCGADDPHQLDLIVPTIKQLKKDGYNVIATLQYLELYQYDTTAQQEKDFRALRDAGAVVVNGSQGHHVQAFDVNAAGFIHYGTGNLFFGDQTFMDGTQQTFVDRHVFYNGKYLGADLRSARIEDMSQPRPMTTAERADLLGTLFKYSYFDK